MTSNETSAASSRKGDPQLGRTAGRRTDQRRSSPIQLVTPGRLRSEAAFATLAGAAPIPASSVLTNQHRLDRAGNRQLNRALHTIMLTAAAPIQPPATTSPADWPKAKPLAKPSDASRGSSPAGSSGSCNNTKPPPNQTAKPLDATYQHQTARASAESTSDG